jgi:hypothetical protein
MVASTGMMGWVRQSGWGARRLCGPVRRESCVGERDGEGIELRLG